MGSSRPGSDARGPIWLDLYALLLVATITTVIVGVMTLLYVEATTLRQKV